MRHLYLALFLACLSLANARPGPDSNYNVNVVTGGGGGPVAFDAAASTSVSNNAGTTLSWTHTPVGTPTAVAVGIESYDGPGGTLTITGITYGGVAMTRSVQAGAQGGSHTELWCLANPASGAKTVTVTFSATGNYAQAGSVTVTGSDTSTCFRNTNSNGGFTLNGIPVTVAVTTVSGDLVVDVLGDVLSGAPTANGSQTLRWGPLTVVSNIAAGSTKAATTTATTMSWTMNQDENWTLCAGAFKAP